MEYTTLNTGMEGFNCQDLPGIADNVTDYFVRGVHRPFVCINSFRSHAQKGWTQKGHRLSRKLRCQWRCASVNVLTNNREEIRARYANDRGLAKNAPSFPYICIFKIKNSTVKVWDTGGKRNPSHRDLIKADEFALDDLEIIDVVKIEDF